MKCYGEAVEKIHEWMDKLDEAKEQGEDCNYIFGILDTLLWVIDDKSGLPI